MGDNVKLVELILDKPRHLRYDFNAFAAFERATGKSFFEMPARPSATDLRALLWALLLHEDKSLTVEQVGELLTNESMPAVAAALLAARTENTPQEDPQGSSKGDTPSPLASGL